MAKVQIGNIKKDIPTTVFVHARTTSVDYEYLYSEIYGVSPKYKCEYIIPKNGDDTTGKIYDEIYQGLVETGDFEVLDYSYEHKVVYNNWNSRDGIDECRVNSYCLASKDNVEPVFIVYSYGSISIETHIGMEKIKTTIEKYLKKYASNDGNVKAYIITNDISLDMDEFNINLKGDLDFDLYNEGFEDVHNKMVKSLDEDENGVYLLYGTPGSGKTTYIRHLIKECTTKDRKFVYIPIELVAELTNMSIISFLMEHKGSVFIIEDCESLVTNTDGGRNGVISNLLNMTDGLLADALHIKFICTFNTDEGEIDEALLRPGRCRVRYKFENLEKSRANKVADKMGFRHIDKDTSLAELFNEDVSFKEEKKRKIGFK